MTTLVFDEDQAARLRALYTTPDVLARRRIADRMLDARPGERIIDIGCGPGFFSIELAAEVGPSGSVMAIDNSVQMLEVAAAAASAAGVAGATVELKEAEATLLPFADESFDATVCVQVLEYVPDVPAALREMHRVLQPGGRALIWDTDWRALAWNSDDEVRMSRVLAAWEQHLVHPSLPRTLSEQLQGAGFAAPVARGHLTVNHRPGPSNYSEGLISLIEPFVIGRDGLTANEVEAWRREFRDLAAAGRYYLACPQVCFVAHKPAK